MLERAQQCLLTKSFNWHLRETVSDWGSKLFNWTLERAATFGANWISLVV